MYTKPNTQWAQVDQEGRLIISREIAERYGLHPGARLRIETEPNVIRLHRPVTHLAKVYIEPTNLCNLDCRTCMRNIWDEQSGQMSEELYDRILENIHQFSPLPSIFFSGIGEPLFHKRTVDWVAKAKAMGIKVELITNGTLLNAKRSRQLIDSGLDTIWISIDGATPESYDDVRLGAELPKVIENISLLRRLRKGGHHPQPVIGIAFVAMRRNIHELPEIIRLGRRLGAKRFMVSNVLPYSEDMQEQTLYNRTLRNITYLPSDWTPTLSLPRMDIDETTKDAFLNALDSGCNVELAGHNLGGANDVCTFIESGSISIGWDGSVSPCPPLLHNHVGYLHGKKRFSRKHVVGKIQEKSLQDLWLDDEYVTYRERVQSFAFAPCTPCGGCELTDDNEEDCFGITHPACGSCLWAQGVIQCP